MLISKNVFNDKSFEMHFFKGAIILVFSLWLLISVDVALWFQGC